MLRFNGVTRQSVARLHAPPAAPLAALATAGISGDSGGGRSISSSSGGDSSAAEGSTAAANAAPEQQTVLVADPGCLAFEYTKSIASAGELRRSALPSATWPVLLAICSRARLLTAGLDAALQIKSATAVAAASIVP